jgi:hypothetical protein
LSPEKKAERAAKVAAAKVGKKMSDEAREKMRLAKLGKSSKLTDEARQRKNASLKAKWASYTPEERAARIEKVSIAEKGKPLTESHRLALVEAWKRRKQI